MWSGDGETQFAFRDPRAMADDFALDGRAGALAELREVLDQLVAEATG